MCSKVRLVGRRVGRRENASGVGVTAVRRIQKNGKRAITIATPMTSQAARPPSPFARRRPSGRRGRARGTGEVAGTVRLGKVLHLPHVLPDIEAADRQDEQEQQDGGGGGVPEIAGDERDVVGGDR